MKRFILFFVLMVVLSLTMSVNGTYAFSQQSAESPEMGTALGAPSLSGKVIETMSSGGYTYVNIEKDGNKTWVAVPNIKVTVGEEIAFQPGMVMANFTSKSLGRTFDKIVFSTGPAGRQGMSSGHGDSGRAPAVAASDAPIKVDKASGPNAYTVSELYEKVDALDKKTVVFKGRVVKFSSKIMDKNWVHIQDGSGDVSKGTNDILVTSQDEVSVGDVVTAKGTLAKDKDFGSGYKYAVIVEETSFSE